MMRAYKDLCVLWIDAHADINTPDGSISGNMHGMLVFFFFLLWYTEISNTFFFYIGLYLILQELKRMKNFLTLRIISHLIELLTSV